MISATRYPLLKSLRKKDDMVAIMVLVMAMHTTLMILCVYVSSWQRFLQISLHLGRAS